MPDKQKTTVIGFLLIWYRTNLLSGIRVLIDHFQEGAQFRFHLPSVDDKIEEAMFQNEF